MALEDSSFHLHTSHIQNRDLQLAMLQEIYDQLAQFPIPSSVELHDLPDDVLSAPELGLYDPAPLLPRFTGSNPNKWLAYAEKYFMYYRIHGTDRFPYLLNCFHNEAAMWLSFYQFTEWPDFIESLVHRFGYTQNALKVFDEMPDGTEIADDKEVHNTIDNQVLTIRIESVVDVNEPLGVKDAQMNILDYKFGLESVIESSLIKGEKHGLLDTVARVIPHFDWKPGWHSGWAVQPTSTVMLNQPSKIVVSANYVAHEPISSFLFPNQIDTHSGKCDPFELGLGTPKSLLTFGFDPGPLFYSAISVKSIHLTLCHNQFNHDVLAIAHNEISQNANISSTMFYFHVRDTYLTWKGGTPAIVYYPEKDVFKQPPLIDITPIQPLVPNQHMLSATSSTSQPKITGPYQLGKGLIIEQSTSTNFTPHSITKWKQLTTKMVEHVWRELERRYTLTKQHIVFSSQGNYDMFVALQYYNTLENFYGRHTQLGVVQKVVAKQFQQGNVLIIKTRKRAWCILISLSLLQQQEGNLLSSPCLIIIEIILRKLKAQVQFFSIPVGVNSRIYLDLRDECNSVTDVHAGALLYDANFKGFTIRILKFLEVRPHQVHVMVGQVQNSLMFTLRVTFPWKPPWCSFCSTFGPLGHRWMLQLLTDADADSNIINQVLIDVSMAFRDDKEIVMEYTGKTFDENEGRDMEKEGEYSNTKGLLIGYDWNQPFSWYTLSNIKPFRKHYSKVEIQSNFKRYFHAIDYALVEVSWCVAFDLLCLCLSEEVYDKIKSQSFVTTEIKKENSKMDGGDNFSISTFNIVTVQSVKEQAKKHFDGLSRLEVLSMRFNHDNWVTVTMVWRKCDRKGSLVKLPNLYYKYMENYSNWVKVDLLGVNYEFRDRSLHTWVDKDMMLIRQITIQERQGDNASYFHQLLRIQEPLTDYEFVRQPVSLHDAFCVKWGVGMRFNIVWDAKNSSLLSWFMDTHFHNHCLEFTPLVCELTSIDHFFNKVADPVDKSQTTKHPNFHLEDKVNLKGGSNVMNVYPSPIGTPSQETEICPTNEPGQIGQQSKQIKAKKGKE